ncbi:hypothetical protein A2U01_0117688, partial [Trifolium medium]|nr:hypothetical protein [Trifolium medium]
HHSEQAQLQQGHPNDAQVQDEQSHHHQPEPESEAP